MLLLLWCWSVPLLAADNLPQVQKTTAYQLTQAVIVGQLDAVEAVMRKRAGDYAAGALSEFALDRIYAAFALAHPNLKTRLDQWISRYPESPHAHAARGRYQVALALQIDADQGGENTASALAAEAQSVLDAAIDDLAVALTLAPSTTPYYGYLIHAHSLKGNISSLSQIGQRGVKQNRFSVVLHRNMLRALSPKAGGSLRQMVEWLQGVEPDMVSHPALSLLRGYVHSTIADLKIGAGERDDAMNHAYKAADLGTDGAELYWLAQTAYRADQLAIAERWLSESITQGGARLRHYRLAAQIALRRDNANLAEALLSQALQLNPTDPRSLEIKATIANAQ